jgi:glycosyltransferase involved in cell wall biosynthesis
MTILFLTRLFYPHIGGVEKHVMEISQRLIKKGHKILVIAENSNIESINGIEVYRINTGNENWLKKFKIWISLWKLRKIIKKADIIHCHDVFFWYLPFRFLFPRKPVYTTFHGYESYPITKKAILIRKISEKLSFGNICIGDFIKKWYGTKPNYVSYGAVNILSLKSEILSQTRRESALFIGRLDDQTGILTYNEAFKILKKKYPKFEFTVIGGGPYRNLLDKKIKALGFQKNPEKYFEDYHFAFVSRYLSILEAMAAKRLVVAVYDNPVKEDYLKMSPFAKFIIIENDPNQLAQKVTYYLNNPQQEKQLVTDAYNWVKKQSWGGVVELYLSLWHKSLERKK